MRKAIHTLRLLLASASMLMFNGPASGQVSPTFIKQIDAKGMDEARDFAVCTNGDFLIACISTSYSAAGDSDLCILRMSPSGDTLWHKSIGGPGQEELKTISPTADGNFLLAGSTSSTGSGLHDIYIVKMDENANVIWSQTYGSVYNDAAYDAKEMPDKSIIVTGYIHTTDPNYPDAFLMKLDATGNKQWIKTYGSTTHDEGSSVSQTFDGGYIIAGHTQSNELNHSLSFLIRTNSTGDTVWTRSYGLGGMDEAHCVQITGDHGYVVVSDQEKGFNNGDFDVCIRKYDDAGNLVWNKVYGGTKKDVVKSIHSTSDGGYVVGAISRSFGFKNPHFWILKLTAAGDTTWTKLYGGIQHQHCYSVRQLSDGGYMAVGHSDSNPAKNINTYVVRTDGAGNVNPSGIEDAQLPGAAFGLYPNPGKGSFTVTADAKVTEVDLVNELGEIVFHDSPESTFTGLRKTYHLENMAKGIYFVRLITNATIIARKLIVE